MRPLRVTVSPSFLRGVAGAEAFAGGDGSDVASCSRLAGRCSSAGGLEGAVDGCWVLG